MDGGTNYGRLEVVFEGERGRVADYDFTNTDADVACRQLGFGGGQKAPVSMTRASSGKVRLDNTKGSSVSLSYPLYSISPSSLSLC